MCFFNCINDLSCYILGLKNLKYSLLKKSHLSSRLALLVKNITYDFCNLFEALICMIETQKFYISYFKICKLKCLQLTDHIYVPL